MPLSSRIVPSLGVRTLDNPGMFAPEAELAFAKEVMAWAEENYENPAGGNWIVETHEFHEIIENFPTLAAAKKYCKLMAEKENEYASY